MDKKMMRSFFLDAELISTLELLSKATRINKSEYVREGLRDLFIKYAKQITEAQKKGGKP